MKTNLFKRVLWLVIPLLTMFNINVLGTAPTGWSQVTALSGIGAGDKILIVTNDGSMYLNGTVNGSGHFNATTLDASHPTNASAAGVIELVSVSSNTYKLKFVSTNRYATATAASSGSAKVNATSDSYGWTFSGSSGQFNAQYQESGKQAYMRSYSNSSFRTYANTKSGKTFQIYKYSPYTITAATNNASYGTVSLSGSTITATPKSGYRVSTTSAYTVTSGTATVTNNGDGTFTVSPTSSCTVQINFEAIPAASISFVNPGTPAPTTSGYLVGDTYTLPSSNNFTCGTKTFVGWSTVAINEPSAQPASNFYAPGAEVTLDASQTFYAVFATSNGGSSKWVLTSLDAVTAGTYAILNQDNQPFGGTVNGSGHGNCESTAFSFTNGEAASAPSGTCEIEFQAVTGGFKMYNATTKKYLYAKSAASGNLAWNASESSYWLYKNSNWTYYSNTAYLRSYGSATGGIRTYGNNSGNGTIRLAKKVSAVSYSDYTTSCSSTFTVTYNGNGNTGGTAPSDATEYSSGATVTVKGNTGSLVKTGYAFGGWNTQTDGNGTNYAADATFSITANTTLYAKWIPTYTVTYNGNGNTGGSVPSDATAYNSGTTVTVKGNTGSLAKTGWTFAGWNTNATGTGTNYTAGSGTFTISANTTLYAKWTCTVTWSVNGATNVYSATTVTYNATSSKVASVPGPPDPGDYCGDQFVGWTSDENYVHGTSNLFTTAGDSPNLNSSGNTTFYAVFADYDD